MTTQHATHWTGSHGRSDRDQHRLAGAWPGVRQFKLSKDSQFAAKLRDIVGLYVNPPDHAFVLSVDEKTHGSQLARRIFTLQA